MATLWMTVFGGVSQTAMGDVIQKDSATIGVTSVQLAAITGDGRRLRTVRVFADAKCYVKWGADPTADSTDVPVGSENPEYFSVEAGQRIAVITRA